jgi:hypothetical protein
MAYRLSILDTKAMIRSAKPKTPEQLRRERISAIKREIAQYEAPSPLGARHDAHVRERWNAKAAELRELLKKEMES